MLSRVARLLMISSEVESLARTGGLGDMVEALSRALGAEGVDVVVVTPKYGVTRVPPGARSWPAPVKAPLGLGHGRELGVVEALLGSGRGAPRACMLSDAELFDRAGIYGDEYGTFGDNAFRFATLASGALSAAEVAFGGALPDIVHAHDWHAALALVYARRARGPRWAGVPLVYTVHNLAYQGVLGARELPYLGVPEDAWDDGWMRHEGNVNLMKGAVEIADAVTTVSETYAREIQHAPHGFGLEAHVRHHRGKLLGIVNGIDTQSFDPEVDVAIARRYSPANALAGKSACKEALRRELGLAADSRAPLFGVVSRLTRLKGSDLLFRVLPGLVERGVQLVVVGTGDASLEADLRAAGARFPGRVAARVVFDPLLARRVFAGSDFTVVPSRDEPCGLTQMYAMRYGAIPIVTPVGGLVDTVVPIDLAHAMGTGVVAAHVDEASVLLACEEALSLWRDPVGLASVVARAMARDSSWSRSAERYLGVYERLRARRPGEG
ncbi:MAG: glycogen synthase [Polyangiaceae bacterium]|nr:glycogen synthase [Polyangiaceae bacterium]